MEKVGDRWKSSETDGKGRRQMEKIGQVEKNRQMENIGQVEKNR